MYHGAFRILLFRAVKKNEIANLKAGLTLANQLINKAQQHQYIPFVLETLLLRAKMYAALGDDQAYLADVSTALHLASSEEMISVFVEEGEIIAKTLKQILGKQLPKAVKPEYLHRILKAFEITKTVGQGTEKEKTEGAMLIEPLTEREIEASCV